MDKIIRLERLIKSTLDLHGHSKKDFEHVDHFGWMFSTIRLPSLSKDLS